MNKVEEYGTSIISKISKGQIILPTHIIQKIKNDVHPIKDAIMTLKEIGKYTPDDDIL